MVSFLFVVTNSCQMYYTPFNDDGGGNFVYLDHHRVDCRQNKMIESVHLMRDQRNKKCRYKYTCHTKPHPCQQKAFNTAFTSDRGGNVFYLDRQNIQCQNDDYISHVFI